MRSGGYANVLLPAFAVLALGFGVGAHRVLVSIKRSQSSRASILVSGVWLLLLLQFALLGYAPKRFVPSRADLEAGRDCVETIGAIEGQKILVLFDAYLADRAGKRAYGAGNPGGDVYRAAPGPAPDELIEEMRRAIRTQHFDAIVLDYTDMLHWTRFGPLFGKDIERFYVPQRRMFARNDVFWPVTGVRTRPELVLVPR